jgi:mannose-1-phosphate guanylyltransferase
MYAVILAGGGGTRLWPLSRPETPKPFLPLVGDRSLLQRTVDRLVGHPELPVKLEDVTVVTDRRYADLVRDQLPGIGVIAEPAGRNTAAAVALATLKIDRDPDEVMLVLPADHLIDRESDQRQALAVAARLAEGALDIDSPLVTLGVATDRPATEYGYLIPDLEGRTRIDGIEVAPLRGFEEKPSHERATSLVREPGTAWNAGIFVWRRSAIRDALEEYGELLRIIEPVVDDEAALAAAYGSVPPLSVDHALMEDAARDHRVAMASMDAGWSDLGGWSALLGALGVAGSGRVVAAGSDAAAGPRDLVVERVDGLLTVAPGPRAILTSTPSALLSDAAPGRAEVDALVRRVTEWENRS